MLLKSSHWSSWLYDILLLSICLGLFFGFMLGSFPIEVPDSARYAEIPREMLQSHDYLIPHLNNLKYFEKPPLFYWLQVFTIKAFGFNNWSVHAVNALFGVFSCLLLYFAGRKLFDRRTGILASLILATNVLFFSMTRIVTIDMTLTTFLSASLFSFILATRNKSKIYLYAMYFFAALAALSKGLIGIVFPCMIIFVWVAILHEWRSLKNYVLFGGILLFLFIAVPWHILVQLKNHDYFNFYFINEHFKRYLTDYAGRAHAFWFFPVALLAGLFPWVFFLFAAIKYHLAYFADNFNHYCAQRLTKCSCFFRRKFWLMLSSITSVRKQISPVISGQDLRPVFIFLLLWPSLIFIFYCFSKSKLVPYILPTFPPIALLIAHYLTSFWQQKFPRAVILGLYFFSATCLLLGLGLIFAQPFLDFSQLAFKPERFYLISVSLFLSSAATFFTLRKFGAQKAIIAMLLSSMLFFLSTAPIISAASNKSIQPLAEIILARIKPQDVIVSFQYYYQDLPYYLKRHIIVVDYYDELKFGNKHEKNHSNRILDLAPFWQRWNYGSQRIFMLVDKKNYFRVKIAANENRLYLLGSYLQTLLLTNMPQK
ncbi:MAG: glycosyltransferase family 39 protein [Gammaproteobacteria bacterium]|nr:glycosyltransferase family 39 protein [Gammaproteobacteria bacterium]